MVRVASLLLVLIASVSSAFAQQGTSDLRGRLLDQQGAALPAVPIVVTNQASGLFRETVSGADGSFLLSGMNPGVYEVTAELTGFKKFQTRAWSSGWAVSRNR